MRNFIYACRSVFKFRSTNVIKLVSLILGLTVGIMLFSRTAFEQSFDNFFPDGDRVYQIIVKSSITNEPDEEYDMIYEPVTAALAQEFSEIEAATHVYRAWYQQFFVDQDKYSMSTIYADSMFFDVLDFGVLHGNPKATLGVKNNIFISEEYAKRMFKEKDPIGQIVMLNNTDPMTVCGIFKDSPENTHIKIDAVLSFATLGGGMNMGWGGGDSYRGYFKFRDSKTVPDVEARMMGALQKYYDYEADAKSGYNIRYFFRPITEVYSSDPTIQMMSLIMALLAFVIIFMSAMNYVLLSLSSLASRAKEVGVHKCNGASSTTIFVMFLYETAIYVLLALGFVALIYASLQSQLEMMVDVTFATLFAPANLWAVLVIVAVLFVVSGVIPAKIFSSISVTQIFRRFTENRRIWKRVLLFSQFLGASFMLSLLLIIMSQYNTMIGRDLGYDTDNLAYVNLKTPTVEKMETVRQEIARMPQVKGVSLSRGIPLNGLSGTMIEEQETGIQLFSSRFMRVDSAYFEVMGMKLVAGQNIIPGDSSIVVNQKFVETMRWSDNSVGRAVYTGGAIMPVAAVVSDFQLGNLYDDQLPLIISNMRGSRNATMNIRFHELTAESARAVNDKLDELLPELDGVRITSYEEAIENQYYAAMLFKNAVTLASIILLLITTMGVVGYIATEIKRRSREIAVRKVMGARAVDVIVMLTRNISLLTVIASAFGATASYIVGDMWQGQFSVKAPIEWWMFAAGGGFVLLLVLLSTTLQTWKIANENPVKSIKSE